MPNGSRTATETVAGGAQSVSYACAVGTGSSNTTGGTNQQSFDYGLDASGDSAIMTATNVFPPPPPAPAPLIVLPRFTGWTALTATLVRGAFDRVGQQITTR